MLDHQGGRKLDKQPRCNGSKLVFAAAPRVLTNKKLVKIRVIVLPNAWTTQMYCQHLAKSLQNTDLEWGDKQGMECTDCTVPFRNQTWEMSICKLCHFPLITLNCQDRSPKGYTISTRWFEQFEYILENKASPSRLLIKYANFNQSKHQHDRNTTLFQLSLVVQDRPLPLRGDSEGGLSASTKKTAARGSSLKMKICIA